MIRDFRASRSAVIWSELRFWLRALPDLVAGLALVGLLFLAVVAAAL